MFEARERFRGVPRPLLEYDERGFAAVLVVFYLDDLSYASWRLYDRETKHHIKKNVESIAEKVREKL